MSKKKRIVIAGSGFGGAYCAQALDRLAGSSGVEVVLIDRHDYLLFYPLLIEAGLGGIETRHALVSIRAFLTSADFRMGEIQKVDLEKKQVTYRCGDEGPTQHLSYDHLVFALGGASTPPEIPGFSDFGYEMKNLGDAAMLGDRAIELMETADDLSDAAERRPFLHFVVVGANFTGIEVAGALNSRLRQIKKRYPRVHPSDIKVTVINRGQRVLKELDEDLGQYAMQTMRRNGVEFLFETTIKRIHRDHAILENGDRIDTRTIVWCAGIAPPPLLRTLALPTDDKGYVLCDPDGRVQNHPEVWAIGDCAVNPDPQGHRYPATAQHALKEGVALAKNLARVLRGTTTEPIRIRSLGSLAVIGHHTGVAKLLGFKFEGLLAWFFYRTIYLVKIPGWARRIRTACDWTLDLLFPRDVVQRGIRRSPALPKAEK